MKKRIGTMLVAVFLLFGFLQFGETAKDTSNVFQLLASAFEGPYHVGNREYMSVIKRAESKQAYKMLPKRLKKAYSQLDEYVYKFFDDVDDIVVQKDDFRKVLEYYRSDHPQAFWLSSAHRYQYDERTKNLSRATLFFSYEDPKTRELKPYTQKQVEKMCIEMDQRADEILSGITDQMTDYEKILYLHDYLAVNVAYNSTSKNQHNAYGALVEKKAVCDGYASAMQYLLLKIGIPCQIVYGDDKSDNPEHHAWNVVKIDDDSYHLDVTWDVPPEGVETPIYANFLVSTEQIEKRHILFSPVVGEKDKKDSFYPPIQKCTDDSLNYYKTQGLYVADLSDESVASILLKTNAALISGEEMIQFQFENRVDLEQFVREAKENVPRVARGFPYSSKQYKTHMITYLEDHILILEFDYA